MVKEDTITYSVKSFTIGNERKLKEVLEKLPGVEVDKSGNVTSQGKNVSKVIVDNNEFFNGNTRLATNNIPADVVEKVEFIDNYNEVSYMKGVENSDKLIMNLKLYKDKKKFAFGELKASAGYNKKYNLKPNLFYYNSRYQINFIGDQNNLGKKEMNFRDIRNLSSDYYGFSPTNRIYNTLDENNFFSTLLNQNFTKSNTTFGAINLNRNFDKIRFDLFSIWNWDKNLLHTEIDNKFIADENYSEFKTTTTNTKNIVGMSKLSFNYKIGDLESMYISFSNNLLKDDKTQRDTTQYATDKINYLLDNGTQKSYLDNLFYWSKQFDSRNTLAFQNNLKFKNSLPDFFIQTNSNSFPQQIPISLTDLFQLGREQFNQSYEWNSNLRYYYKYKKYHIFQITLANQHVFEKHNSFEYQKINPETYIDFKNSGFGTNSKLQLNNCSIDLAYKLKFKKWDSNLNFTYYYLLYHFSEESQTKSFSKKLILPSLHINYKLKKGYSIIVHGGFKSNLPELNKLTNTYTMMSQNSVYKGASNLSNDLVFNSSFTLSKFSLMQNFFLNFSMGYDKKLKSIEEFYLFNGFNRFQSSKMVDNPSESYYTRIYFNKFAKYISININANYSNSLSKLNSNLTISNFTYNSLGSKIGVKSKFKTYPNLGLSYQFSKTFSTNEVLKNNYQSTIFGIDFEAQFLKYFQIKSELSSVETRNQLAEKGTKNYDLTTLLTYHKENSLWYFDLEGINLMNNKYKFSYNQTDYFITSIKQYNLERSILLSITYKF